MADGDIEAESGAGGGVVEGGTGGYGFGVL